MKMSVYGTARTIGMILWIIFAASSFVGVFIVGGGGDFIRETLLGLGMGRWGTLIVIQLILILLGMFLEPISILILTVPIVMPIVAELRFDMVWYGVLFVINMQMAYITPPFGPSLFYLKGVAPPEITLDDIYRSVPPFIIIQGITLTLLMIFPQIALWLPGMMIK
jgi:TRAP-type mannitol/chloroaromatic compound transport system permease large subunit